MARTSGKQWNDVFRLVQLLRSDASITLPEPIRFDLQTLWTKLRLTTCWIPQRLMFRSAEPRRSIFSARPMG